MTKNAVLHKSLGLQIQCLDKSKCISTGLLAAMYSDKSCKYINQSIMTLYQMNFDASAQLCWK